MSANDTLFAESNYVRCCSSMLLPCDRDSTWNEGMRALVYFGGLFYCFLGVAMCTNILLESMQKLNSRTKKISAYNHKSGRTQELHVTVFGGHLANMMGSSVPAILLCLVEIIGKNFMAGDLGPGTVVGAAALNLFIITAVCVALVPSGESKKITDLPAFAASTVFSSVAFLWIFITLSVISMGMIEPWEAAVTVVIFPIFILVSHLLKKIVHRQATESGDPNTTELADGLIETPKQRGLSYDGRLTKEQLLNCVEQIRKYPGLSENDISLLAASFYEDLRPRPRLWFRINAVQNLTGSKRRLPPMNKDLKKVYDATRLQDASAEEVTPQTSDHNAVVEFQSSSCAVNKKVDMFPIVIYRKGKTDNGACVRVESIDGTAAKDTDYKNINEAVNFEPGEISKQILIEVVGSDGWEADKELHLKMYLPFGQQQQHVTLGKFSDMKINIYSNDAQNQHIDTDMLHVAKLTEQNTLHSQSTCLSRIKGAIWVNGGDNLNATFTDYVLHFFSLGWKIIFALIPPPSLLRGWPTFFVSLIALTIITALIADLASIFGCIVGLTDYVNGLTIIALGLSVPDLLASKMALSHDKHADAAIAGVATSNCINLSLGIGLSWLAASSVHLLNGYQFILQVDAIAFTVLLFLILSFVFFVLLFIRRLSRFGSWAELGGKSISKYVSAVIMILLWLTFTTVSTLYFYI